MQKAVFFDRDGVINELVNRGDERLTSPWKVSEIKYYVNIGRAVSICKSLGYKVFVITNQPGIVDGDMTVESHSAIMNKVISDLQFDDGMAATIRNNYNYKPNKGMFDFLIEKYNIDRSNSWLIGDRWKDIVPGHSSGLKTIFVGKEYSCPEEYACVKPDYVTKNAYEASKIIEKETQ